MHRFCVIFILAWACHATLEIHNVAPPFTGTTVPEGQTQAFLVFASSDSAIDYTWFVDDVEQIGQSASLFAFTPGFDSIIHVDLAPLEKASTVRCEVRTDLDPAQVLTWNITITDVNRAPVVQGSASITPGPRASVNANLTCLFTGTIVDPDPEDSVQFMFEWSSGEKYTLSCPIGATEDVLQTEVTEAGETWTCNVFGMDQLQLRSTPATTTVDINTPPTVSDVHLLDDHGIQTLNFFPGDNMQAVPTSADLDGDSVTFAYSWLRDGDDSGSTASTLFLDEGIFAYNQEVTLLVNAIDAYDIGPPTQISTTLGWRFRFNWAGQSCYDLAFGLHHNASDGADGIDVLSTEGDTARIYPGRPGNLGSAHNVDIRAIGDDLRWLLALDANEPLSWNQQPGVPPASLIMYPIDRHGYVIGDIIHLSQAGVLAGAPRARQFVIRLSEGQTQMVDWPEGWSLQGTPTRLAHTALSAVFDTFDPAFIPPILSWDGAALVNATELPNQKGVWVHAPRDLRVALRGSNAVENVLELDAGWNLISVLGYVEAPNFAEQGSLFWGFDNHTQRYRAAIELAPGNGYWIYCKAPVTLDLTQ